MHPLDLVKQVDGAERIRRLLSTQKTAIRSAFERMIRQIRSELTLSEIEALIINGNIEAAFVRAETAITSFARAVTATYIAAGQATAATMASEAAIIIAFDVANVRAVNAIRNSELNLITEFNDQMRRSTRQAITRGIQAGINPRAQAREFRNAIALTAKQEAAVANFRRFLETRDRSALRRKLRDRRFDRTIEAAIRNDKPLTSAQINRMVERYRERSLIDRSETIARTESLRSLNEASDEAWSQAVDDGQVDATRIVRQWITARDERVRGSHGALNRTTTSQDGVFTSGFGNTLRFPGDPRAPGEDTINCRCVVTTRLAPVPKPQP